MHLQPTVLLVRPATTHVALEGPGVKGGPPEDEKMKRRKCGQLEPSLSSREGRNCSTPQDLCLCTHKALVDFNLFAGWPGPLAFLELEQLVYLACFGLSVFQLALLYPHSCDHSLGSLMLILNINLTTTPNSSHTTASTFTSFEFFFSNLIGPLLLISFSGKNSECEQIAGKLFPKP